MMDAVKCSDGSFVVLRVWVNKLFVMKNWMSNRDLEWIDWFACGSVAESGMVNNLV